MSRAFGLAGALALALAATGFRFPRVVRGNTRRMRLVRGVRGLSLPVLWVVVGLVVAAVYDYFDRLGTAGRVLSALVAVLLWPLLLFGFEIRISR